jgi:hypothetical protein
MSTDMPDRSDLPTLGKRTKVIVDPDGSIRLPRYGITLDASDALELARNLLCGVEFVKDKTLADLPKVQAGATGCTGKGY